MITFFSYFFAEAEKSKTPRSSSEAKKLLFSTFIRLFLRNTQSYRYVPAYRRQAFVHMYQQSCRAAAGGTQNFVNAV